MSARIILLYIMSDIIILLYIMNDKIILLYIMNDELIMFYIMNDMIILLYIIVGTYEVVDVADYIMEIQSQTTSPGLQCQCEYHPSNH